MITLLDVLWLPGRMGSINHPPRLDPGNMCYSLKLQLQQTRPQPTDAAAQRVDPMQQLLQLKTVQKS